MIDTEKYEGMDVERLNGMSDEERSTYYAELYQYLGVLIDVFADVDGVNSLKGRAEHFTYSAAVNAHTALLDALAALTAGLD